MLHSRFTREDRRAKTEIIDRWFGKSPDDTDCILVATQVIEVGLDISCSRLHTEIAPANALVQRSGRCARFGGEGKVFVYDVLREKHNPHLPYSADLIEATANAISRLCGQPVGYVDELAFVQTVHDETDQRAIKEFEREARTKQMEEAIRSLSPRYYRELVRNVDAINAIVLDRPDTTTNPFSYEAFSLPISVLMGKFKQASEAAPEQIFAWFARERPADDLYNRTTYEWQPVNKGEEMLFAPRIALNPAFASYNIHLGLQMNVAGRWKSPLLPQRPATDRPFYVRETYEEHISKVWRACKHHFLDKHRLSHAGRRLEQVLGLPRGTVDLLLRLVIAFHDIAKLTKGWQEAVYKYQIAIGHEPAGIDEFLAHTDYDPLNEFQKNQEKRYPRPPHALEGAISTSDTVAALFCSLSTPLRDMIVKAYLAAVATHHSPTTSDIREEQVLMSGAVQEAGRIAREVVGVALTEDLVNRIKNNIPRCKRLNEKFPLPQDGEAFLLYLLLVRTLRLSDQHSFEEKRNVD
jgi:CRISPR-associated endonuclease/helicase Cas3